MEDQDLRWNMDTSSFDTWYQTTWTKENKTVPYIFNGKTLGTFRRACYGDIQDNINKCYHRNIKDQFLNNPNNYKSTHVVFKDNFCYVKVGYSSNQIKAALTILENKKTFTGKVKNSYLNVYLYLLKVIKKIKSFKENKEEEESMAEFLDYNFVKTKQLWH